LRGWTVAGLVVLACAAQTSLFLSLAVFGVRPDLVLIVVCASGLALGPGRGAAAGLLAGLFVDALTGRLVGLGAITKGVAGYAAGWMGRRLFPENALVPVAIAFAVSAGEGLLYLLGTHLFGVPIPLAAGFVGVVVPEACYNAVVSAFLLPLLSRVLKLAEAYSNARRPVEG